MNSEIPIGVLLNYLWLQRFKMTLFSIFVIFIAAIWLMALPNKYKSQVVFMAEQSESESGLSSLASSFGGVASLAGLNLGSDNQTEIEAEYLLTAESFLLDVVMTHNYLPQVVAANDYDLETETLQFDSSIYDATNGKWAIEGDRKSRSGQYPANWYIVKKLRDTVSIAKDNETQLMTLIVEHYSPVFAQNFAETILSEINKIMKERESKQIERRLDFLRQQLEQELQMEIKQSVYALLEQQLKQKMIVETSENFIFKIIEPPVVPEIKSSPLRMLSMIITVIISVGSAILYFIFKYILLVHPRSYPG